jgi:hypothetical protein
MTSGGTGEWPTVDELMKLMDAQSDTFDHQFERFLAAAIDQVKHDVGEWDDAEDDPDDSLAQAALLLAVRIARAPGQAPRSLAAVDPDYSMLLKGHRRRFPIG